MAFPSEAATSEGSGCNETGTEPPSANSFLDLKAQTHVATTVKEIQKVQTQCKTILSGKAGRVPSKAPPGVGAGATCGHRRAVLQHSVGENRKMELGSGSRVLGVVLRRGDLEFWHTSSALIVGIQLDES